MSMINWLIASVSLIFAMVAGMAYERMKIRKKLMRFVSNVIDSINNGKYGTDKNSEIHLYEMIGTRECILYLLDKI